MSRLSSRAIELNNLIFEHHFFMSLHEFYGRGSLELL
ncbi:hypothetical protein ACJIZ3_000078 [Penstemon smallii]|uniref:Maturase K n=1 Tax=Penstemon smallii TaxID=265156 RepID=A0ABD3RHK2_9LAMI